MCSMCLQYPCDSRCPNTTEQKPVYKCCVCGYGIFSGDKYYDGPEGYMCEDCIEDMAAKEFMKLIGETFSTAEKEE